MSILSTQGNGLEANPPSPHCDPLVKFNPRWTYTYRSIVSIIHWCHDPENYSAAMNVLEVFGIKPKKRAAIFRRAAARGHGAAFSPKELDHDRMTARLWYQFLALAHHDDLWVIEYLEASKWYRNCRCGHGTFEDSILDQVDSLALRYKSREAFLKATWNSMKPSDNMLDQSLQNA
jgi:hypothetical protein